MHVISSFLHLVLEHIAKKTLRFFHAQVKMDDLGACEYVVNLPPADNCRNITEFGTSNVRFC